MGIGFRATDERGELLEPAVLQERDRLGTRGIGRSAVRALALRIPINAVLERVGGQVDLAASSLLVVGEVGAVARDEGRREGLADLAVVGPFAAQGRERL